MGGSTGENGGWEYEEVTEYTKDGKIDYYKSIAFVDWIGGEKEEKDTLLAINYIYRDDGTLYYLSLDDNLGYCIPTLVRFH